MTFSSAEYTGQEAAKAAGVTPKFVANIDDRGFLLGRKPNVTGKGRTRKYSWRDVMHMATAKAIMETGVSSPKDAFAVAAYFSHFSDETEGAVGGTSSADIFREPGLPFHHMRGITMFYVAGPHSTVILHNIFGPQKEAPWRSIHFHLDERLHGARGYIALNMSELFRDICFRMGVDYRVVLDDAYRGHDEAVNWRIPGEGGR